MALFDRQAKTLATTPKPINYINSGNIAYLYT
uniref:Uncharacterized protein n=1 Tax=Anguilla anguilla TaxID=7936 RepID=A0A0E9QD70_ANGAN